MVNSQQSTDHCKFLEPQPLFFNWKVQKVGISAVCVVRVESAVVCRLWTVNGVSKNCNPQLRAHFPKFQIFIPFITGQKADNHINW